MLILDIAVEAEVETAKEESKFMTIAGRRSAVENALRRRHDLDVQIGTVVDMDENNRIVEAKITLRNTDAKVDPYYIEWYKLEKKDGQWVALSRDLVADDWVVDKEVAALPITIDRINDLMALHLHEELVMGAVGELLTKDQRFEILQTMDIEITRSGLMFERLAPFIEAKLDDGRIDGRKYRYVFDADEAGVYHLVYDPIQLPWTDS